MRRVLALVIPLALVACSGSAPALAPDWISPAADAALPEPERALLAEVVRSVEAHDWDAFAATLDPDGLAEQTAFLVANGAASAEAAQAQVVREAFCCPVPPFGARGEGVGGMLAGLDRIDRLLIQSVTGEPGGLRDVDAVLVLDDGSRHPVGWLLDREDAGRVFLVVAMG